MKELRFEELSVHYGGRRGGLTAVDGVTLTVPPGQVVGLVGESGSGKSSLAKAAVGLSPVSAGRVLLDGADVRRLPKGHRPLQMVFQDPYSSLDPRMTVGESIAEAMPRDAYRRASERREEVARLLGLVNLDPALGGLRPSRMSGGQRQRVGLARALAGRPDVVIADEVTSALDVSVQGTVLNLVKDLQRRLNLSMLFISHNLAVVRYVSDVVAVMYLGRIVEAGPVAQVLGDPQHPYTRDLLAASPSLHDSDLLADDPAATGDAEPADPHDPPAGCRYHPRCPLGPAVHPGRTICGTTDPGDDADRGVHQVACHFPGAGIDPRQPRA
ncbi:ABC transporter ATP-binding protein [Streptomyces sp. NPDC056405]|uniref:ABC transporter ATP-binding protein n=1 Tax=Streptomyces sp. NPDC056405 TaxID=3345811 RepID=UPI0035DD62BD